jgi:hypothetical protein
MQNGDQGNSKFSERASDGLKSNAGILLVIDKVVYDRMVRISDRISCGTPERHRELFFKCAKTLSDGALHHGATGRHTRGFIRGWWARKDSNLGPTEWK